MPNSSANRIKIIALVIVDENRALTRMLHEGGADL